MKKLFLSLSILCSTFIFTSCGSDFKSEVRPLKSHFSTFTALDEETDEILIGVKSENSGQVIIPPGKYLSFDVDDKYAYATSEEGVTIFEHNGKKLFDDVFSKFEANTLGFYIAKKENNEVYVFFPDNFILIPTQNYHIIGSNILVELEDTWSIFNNNGVKQWSFPKNSILLHSLDPAVNNEYVVAVTETKKSSTIYKIYTLDGKRKVVYTEWTWSQLMKKKATSIKIGSLEVIDIAMQNLAKQ